MPLSNWRRSFIPTLFSLSLVGTIWRPPLAQLVDSFIYVIDVAEGDKIPRKGGPAINVQMLLIINKNRFAHRM